jgi:glycosyltransferase involved in cell wall biosynthesis
MNDKVLVLLATYNGELFLDKQLESINSQLNYRVECWVQDDGSTDGTLEILKKWNDIGLVTKIFHSQHGKPGYVFIDLINEAPTGYYVFLSDQDDIWQEQKVRDSIDAFASSDTLLVCSDRNLLLPRGKIRIRNRKFNFSWSNALIQNCVFGNTVCLSPAGVSTLKSRKIPYFIYHDAFLYLHFSQLKSITQLKSPRTEYRIHSNQVVGLPRPIISRVREGVMEYSNFVERYLVEYNADISFQNLELYRNLKRVRQTKSMFTKVRQVFVLPVTRQKRTETIIWKLLYCFF